jgi:hypothetical protein
MTSPTRSSPTPAPPFEALNPYDTHPSTWPPSSAEVGASRCTHRGRHEAGSPASEARAGRAGQSRGRCGRGGQSPPRSPRWQSDRRYGSRRRCPGCVSFLWAVLDRASPGWRWACTRDQAPASVPCVHHLARLFGLGQRDDDHGGRVTLPAQRHPEASMANGSPPPGGVAGICTTPPRACSSDQVPSAFRQRVQMALSVPR